MEASMMSVGLVRMAIIALTRPAILGTTRVLRELSGQRLE
jgi:hypothetical protein